MRIEHHPSPERGVQQLMYVGADGLPDENAAGVLAMMFAAGYGAAKTRGILRVGLFGLAILTAMRVGR